MVTAGTARGRAQSLEHTCTRTGVQRFRCDCAAATPLSSFRPLASSLSCKGYKVPYSSTCPSTRVAPVASGRPRTSHAVSASPLCRGARTGHGAHTLLEATRAVGVGEFQFGRLDELPNDRIVHSTPIMSAPVHAHASPMQCNQSACERPSVAADNGRSRCMQTDGLFSDQRRRAALHSAALLSGVGGAFVGLRRPSG